ASRQRKWEARSSSWQFLRYGSPTTRASHGQVLLGGSKFDHAASSAGVSCLSARTDGTRRARPDAHFVARLSMTLWCRSTPSRREIPLKAAQGRHRALRPSLPDRRERQPSSSASPFLGAP